ncbi:GAF domain-containing SpoIIE family protein phosphatase [Streptomyces sp. NPDC093970]|uniref:GAF domain-containing SpoIIE family protein phosphatase n=1 Tax=Streptomyces sp. NPDC093970 TaxID=3155076 RepID=UPI00342661FA
MKVVTAAASGHEEASTELAARFRRLSKETAATSAMLFLLAPDEPVLKLSMLYGTSWTVLSPWTRIHVEESIPVAEATRERRLVWVGDSEKLALHYPRLALMVPEHAVTAAPIMAGETVYGAVCLLWPPSHPRHLSARQTAAIHAYCDRAGQVLEQAELSGDPVLPGEHPLVLDADRSPPPDPTRALAAYEYADRLPGAMSLDLEGRTTFVSDAAAGLLDIRAADLLGTRPWERVRWLGNTPFEDGFRATLIGHRPVHFTAGRAGAEPLSVELHPGASGVSVHMTVPSPTSPAGRPRHVPSPTAQAESRLFHQLMHLAAGLTETVRVKDVAETIANRLLPAFGAAGLILMAAREGRLHVVGQRGYTTDFLSLFDGHLLSSANPPAMALTAHTPLFFSSFTEFKRAYPSAVQHGTRNAWAFLPLIIRGRPVGILVLSFDRVRQFPPAERNLMVSMAGLVAQALDRACLHEAKDDLARTLQNGLLPQRLPTVPGLQVAARYLPAARGMDIGGDFYDLIRNGPGTATAVIGDVQGHNVQAAALMGQLRTAVHTHAIAGMSPDDLLARTNQVMCDFNPGLFASCLCVQLDLARHRAQLATAGHPPPLLHHEGRAQALMVPPGPLLGVVANAEYPLVDIPLAAGTTLALYTDGLVEAPGIDIADAIADLTNRFTKASGNDVEVLVESLLGDCSHHSRTDDIAMLLVRVAS